MPSSIGSLTSGVFYRTQTDILCAIKPFNKLRSVPMIFKSSKKAIYAQKIEVGRAEHQPAYVRGPGQDSLSPTAKLNSSQRPVDSKYCSPFSQVWILNINRKSPPSFVILNPVIYSRPNVLSFLTGTMTSPKRLKKELNRSLFYHQILWT